MADESPVPKSGISIVDWTIAASKALGVGTVFAVVLLYGMYSVGDRAITEFKPMADDAVRAHIEYLRKTARTADDASANVKQAAEILTAQQQRIESLNSISKAAADAQAKKLDDIHTDIKHVGATTEEIKNRLPKAGNP